MPPVLSSVIIFLPPYAVKEGEAWTVSNIWLCSKQSRINKLYAESKSWKLATYSTSRIQKNLPTWKVGGKWLHHNHRNWNWIKIDSLTGQICKTPLTANFRSFTKTPDYIASKVYGLLINKKLDIYVVWTFLTQQSDNQYQTQVTHFTPTGDGAYPMQAW